MSSVPHQSIVFTHRQLPVFLLVLGVFLIVLWTPFGHAQTEISGFDEEAEAIEDARQTLPAARRGSPIEAILQKVFE